MFRASFVAFLRSLKCKAIYLPAIAIQVRLPLWATRKQEKLWVPHPQRHTRPWMGLWSMKGVPVAGVEAVWALGSLPTQTTLGFYSSM